jgi:hypothetical protein
MKTGIRKNVVGGDRGSGKPVASTLVGQTVEASPILRIRSRFIDESLSSRNIEG